MVDRAKSCPHNVYANDDTYSIIYKQYTIKMQCMTRSELATHMAKSARETHSKTNQARREHKHQKTNEQNAQKCTRTTSASVEKKVGPIL